MTNAQDYPQLSFVIDNVDAPSTIYITTDTEVNKLTFFIKTNTADTAFTAGTVVPPDDAPDATGSLLYLDLSPLQIPKTDFDKITCAATGWDYKLYPDSIIGFSPTVDVTIAPKSPVKILMNNVVLPTPPSGSSVNLPVTYYRVTPTTSGNIPQVSFFKELLQNPPEGHADLHGPIACVLNSDNYICNTIEKYPQVDNNLSFVFQPGSAPATVKASADTAFTVSFIYAPSGPGYGALTSASSASDNIKIKQGQNASDWKVVPKPDADNPSWVLVPPDGKDIIGSGIESIVQFDIQNIVTEFEPGPTLMYVQYTGIKGYDDGSYYMVLTKVPHVDITSLTVKPNPAVIEGGKASVTISWEVKNFESLLLMPFYKDVTKMTSFSGTLKTTTPINLVATGPGKNANQATDATTAYVLPVINSFEVTPTAVYAGDYPHDARFFWNVDTNDQVLLIDDRTHNSQTVQKSDATTKTVAGAGMWTLQPQNAANPYTLMRNVQIQSFSLQTQKVATGFSNSVAAASPSAEYVAVINSASGNVSILNALNFSKYTDPVATGSGGVDLAFANSGKYIFVLNSPGNLAIIKVTYDNNKQQFVFSLLTPVTLTDTPVRMCVSDDDKYIFISTSAAGGGKLVVVENKGNDNFSVKQSISVGSKPMGIATDPSGSQVYVTNNADNSVSVIGYSSINDAFVFSRSITDIPSPVDIAVADSQGKTLLVVSPGSPGKLIIADYNDDGTVPRQELDLGKNPSRVATTPGRAYAMVTNTESNTASLVSCYGGTGNCKVLKSDIATGSKPVAISMTADGTSAFVANGDSSVTTVNLVNYQMNNTPVAIGKLPTSVAASADGVSVVSWRNVLINPSKAPFSKGLYIYETKSGTVIRKMENDEIIKCVFTPSVPTDLMYLIKKNDNNITVLDTAKFTVKTTLPIPLGEADAKRYPIDLGISEDGQNIYATVKDDKGNHSFIAFGVSEDDNLGYELNADILVFKNASSSNNVLMQNTPDGTNVYIVSALDNRVWNLKEAGEGSYTLNTKTVSLELLATCIAASPDNTRIYIISQQNMDSDIAIISTADFSIQIRPFPASYSTVLVNFQQMVVSPDNTKIFLTDADVAGIRVMSATTLRVIQTLSWSQSVAYPIGISMLPNGSTIYVAGYYSNTMAIINQIK